MIRMGKMVMAAITRGMWRGWREERSNSASAPRSDGAAGGMITSEQARGRAREDSDIPRRGGTRWPLHLLSIQIQWVHILQARCSAGKESAVMFAKEKRNARAIESYASNKMSVGGVYPRA